MLYRLSSVIYRFSNLQRAYSYADTPTSIFYETNAQSSMSENKTPAYVSMSMILRVSVHDITLNLIKLIWPICCEM